MEIALLRIFQQGDKRLREFLLAVGLQSSGWKALEVRVSTVSAVGMLTF